MIKIKSDTKGWRDVTKILVKKNSVWKNVAEGWMKKNDTWERVTGTAGFAGDSNTGRFWADGTYATCGNEYRHPELYGDTKHLYDEKTGGDGFYLIKPEGFTTLQKVYCDMVTDGGGFTSIPLTVGDNINPLFQVANTQEFLDNNVTIIDSLYEKVYIAQGFKLFCGTEKQIFYTTKVYLRAEYNIPFKFSDLYFSPNNFELMTFGTVNIELDKFSEFGIPPTKGDGILIGTDQNPLLDLSIKFSTLRRTTPYKFQDYTVYKGKESSKIVYEVSLQGDEKEIILWNKGFIYVR